MPGEYPQEVSALSNICIWAMGKNNISCTGAVIHHHVDTAQVRHLWHDGGLMLGFIRAAL